MKNIFLLIIILIIPFTVLISSNYGSISGYIRSVSSGDYITNASVAVTEINVEVKPDFTGRYIIIDLLPGKYQIKVTAPGYKELVKIVEVLEGQPVPMNFFLEESGRDNSQVGSLAEAAKQKPDNTYILRNNNDLRLENSNRLPNAFNVFPGVFITDRGNQNLYPEMYYRGTSRLNVNINGIPMNDCFGDYHLLQNQPDILAFTSAAVIQPGGGTLFNDDYPATGSISIITKRPNPKPGVSISQFYGAGNAFTTTVSGSTGRLGAFSLETGLVTNSTEGLIEKLWNSSMSYYFAADYDNGGAHRFEFTFMGTYKRHANRDDLNYIWFWDLNFAKEQGMEFPSDNIGPGNFGEKHNPDWGATDFSSEEFYWSRRGNPKYRDFLNSSVTYSHTPMGNLNWNWKMTDNISLNNNFYFSVNTGGTSGFAVDLPIMDNNNGTINFNELYLINIDTGRINPRYPESGREAMYLLQNIASHKISYGWQGILNFKFSENISSSLLFNYSNDDIKSYREVRNLLGGDYMLEEVASVGRTEFIRGLGDKFGYYSEGIIDKIGIGASANIHFGDLSINALAMASLINYTKKDLLFNSVPDFEKSGMTSIRFSGLANYKIVDGLSVFIKSSFYNNPAQYGAMFGDSHIKYDSVENEECLNIDLGTVYEIGYFRAVLNFYYHQISGYSFTDYISTYHQLQKLTYLNMEQEGTGGELYLFYKPNDMFEIMLSGTISKSKWLSNGMCSVSDLLINSKVEGINKMDVKDIISGGAPQKSLAFSGTVYPYEKSYISFTLNFYADNYSQILPWSYPADAEKKYQPWKIPDYFLLEAHAAFDLPFIEFLDINIYCNMYNILGSKYIAQSYEGNFHSGQWTNLTFNNIVVFGLPLSWDIGLRIGL